MAIPHSVLAAGWIPFVVVLVLTLLFSFIYVRYFQSKYDSEVCSTIASILGVTVALLTTALVPVDIFLVSYMKDGNGHFKDWAQTNTTRQSIENGVLYAYYALYSCVVLFVFLILPFCYFYYEEGDDDTTTKSRICSAVKFTAVFVFVASVLLLIGAFVPLKNAPNVNGTEWDKIKNIFEDLGTYRGEDALSFVISSLTLIGMFAVVIYTAYGMSAWPMDLVKGRRSATKERMEIADNRADRQAEIDSIRAKYRNGRRRMTSRDRRRIEELEDEDRLMARREHNLERVERSCLAKCAVILRPFQIVFGIIFFAMALLVFLSLLLTNIDKVMHSLGPRMGYALPKRTLPNPIDITLVFAEKAFPVDYILMVGIILYFFFCSMGGLQHIGIWCCWIRMYKIRPRHTKPQGLLFLCFILMFIVLALNVLIYQITPQYSTFGSQHYVHHDKNATKGGKLMPCSTDAPADECVMTRMSMLLTRFFYKIWFFGACYYWASWAFLGLFVVGFVVSLVRKRRSQVEGSVDRDDFESDDEELLRA